jgi:hypothetical protein
MDIAILALGIASLIFAKRAGDFVVRCLEKVDAVAERYEDRQLEGKSVVVRKRYEKLSP